MFVVDNPEIYKDESDGAFIILGAFKPVVIGNLVHGESGKVYNVWQNDEDEGTTVRIYNVSPFYFMSKLFLVIKNIELSGSILFQKVI